MKFLAAIPVIGFLLVVAVWAIGIVGTIVGLYLAFSASILLGIIVLLVEPAPLVIGLVYLFMGIDLAAKIMQALGKM